MDDHTVQSNRVINTVRRCKATARVKRDHVKVNTNMQHTMTTMEACRRRAFLHYDDRGAPSPVTANANQVEEILH